VPQSGRQPQPDQHGGDRLDAGIQPEADQRHQTSQDAGRHGDGAFGDVVRNRELGKPQSALGQPRCLRR
jgi:hypothetical protein